MTKTRETLVLPNEVGALWNALRGSIRRALKQLDAGAEYTIGGGTILAARWRHRKSWDIDLQLSMQTSLRSLDDPKFNWFRKTVEQHGGTLVPGTTNRLYRIHFGQEPKQQRIDLWIHSPEITAGQTTAVVNGEPETVLSTGQILRGKLERASWGLGRDLYDILQAAEHEPEGLETAANAISQKKVIQAAANWKLNRGRIGANARSNLTGLPTERPLQPYTLAAEAGNTLMDACYSVCRIRGTEHGVEIETTTYGGRHRTRSIDAAEAATRLEALGLNAHLRENGADPAVILARAAGSPSAVAYEEIDGQRVYTERETPQHDPAQRVQDAAQRRPEADSPNTAGSNADKNALRERHRQRNHTSGEDKSSTVDLTPPSRELLAKRPTDHSNDLAVTRRKTGPVGGETTRKPRRHTRTATPSDDKPGGHKR